MPTRRNTLPQWVAVAAVMVGCATTKPPVPAAATDETPISVEAPATSAEASVPEPVSPTWNDPDALPPGAHQRFGSMRFTTGPPVALLADGSIVSQSGSGDLRLVARDGRERPLAEHGRFRKLDGRRVAVAGGRAIRIIDGTTAEVQSEWPAEGCELNTSTFSHDGSTVACGWGELRVYDVESGQLRFQTHHDRLYTRAGGVAVTDKMLAFLAGDGPDLNVYELESGELIRKSNAEGIEALTFDRAGRNLLLDMYSGGLMRVDARTGEENWRYERKKIALSFPILPSPDDSLLAVRVYDSSSSDPDGQNASVLDLRRSELKILGPMYAHGFDFSVDGTQLAAGGLSELAVYDLRSGKTLAGPAERFEPLIQGVVWETRLYTLSESGILLIYDRDSGRRILKTQLKGDDGEYARWFTALRVVDASTLVASTKYGESFVVDSASGEVRCTAAAHGHDLVPLGDGRHFAAIYGGSMPDDWPYDGAVYVFDTQCERKALFEYRGAVVDSVVDGEYLQITATDGSAEEMPENQWDDRVRIGTWKKSRVNGSRRSLVWGRKAEDDALLQRLGAVIEDGWATWRVSHDRRLEFDSGSTWFVRSPGKDTLVIFVVDQKDDHYEALVFDAATDQLRRVLTLPPDLFQISTATVDPTGRWMTIVEHNSLLLYDLGPR